VPCFAEGGAKLNKRNKSFDLYEEVDKQISVWHNREACVEVLLKKSDELADVNPLLGVWGLFDLINLMCRFF
jgi:hypothetical protein